MHDLFFFLNVEFQDSFYTLLFHPLYICIFKIYRAGQNLPEHSDKGWEDWNKKEQGLAELHFLLGFYWVDQKFHSGFPVTIGTNILSNPITWIPREALSDRNIILTQMGATTKIFNFLATTFKMSQKTHMKIILIIYFIKLMFSNYYHFNM